jgi:tetratricopeptide (TPR) repeat protein
MVDDVESAFTNARWIDAATVLDLLCGLPLALTQAGAYMRETNVSASEYAQHYNQTWGRLMKKQERHPLESYGERSVLTTWMVSYEQVQRQSEAAAWLLKLWGHLDNGELWYELIAAGKGLAGETDIPRWLCELAEDRLEFGEAAGLLCRYSLADATAESGSFSMHAVVHRWCSQLAEGQEQQELYHMAAELVAEIVPMEKDLEYWRNRKRLLAHGISVSKRINDEGVGADAVATLFLRPEQYYSLGYLLADDDRQGAVKLYERALQGGEKAWGEEHASTLNTANNLGLLYADLGLYKEAEKMYKQALKGKEKAWAEEHTLTLNTVNNLANLYKTMGRHNEAEKMYKRALQGKEMALGKEHTSTLNTVNNLANLYASLGQHKEAEEMYKRALQGKEKALGKEHTSTLDTVNNLGLLYADLGQHKKAEALLGRALEGYKSIWGEEHTSTLETVSNLGLLYAGLERYKEAEALLVRALEGFNEALGPEHPSTLETVNNLGFLYAGLGRYKEAEALLIRALEGFNEALGPKHLSTLETVNSLGKLYTQSGNHKKAKEMLERALEGFEKAAEREQISVYVPTLDVMETIAILSDSQGCVDDARMWFEKALSGYEKVFGREDLRCQRLHAKLAALGGPEKDSKARVQATPAQEQVHNQIAVASNRQQLGSWSVGLGHAGLEHWECCKRPFFPVGEALDTLD